MKLLGIDYGSKRIGIAETDELQIIASPLTTVEAKEFYPWLAKYLAKNKVETIVVGEPRHADGNPTHATEGAQKMAEKIAKLYPTIKIARVGESHSSTQAFDAMIAGGLGKKARRNKETIDKVSAAIILKRYMENDF